MKVQTFTGKDMRDALGTVRDALGPDAMILDTREIDGGIEVRAAADEPETSPAPAVPVRDDAPALPLVDTEVLAARLGLHVSHTEDFELMREQVESIRCLMESHIARAGWTETNLTSPVTAKIMRNLSALGIAPDVVKTLLARMKPEDSAGQSWSLPLKTLQAAIPCSARETIGQRGVVAVVGPTGAGKTTTVAKLAARFVMDKTADRLALVSLDNYRLGASEQIDALGQIIGSPIYRPRGDSGLADVLGLLDRKELVLIDTVGMGHHDPRLAAQLSRLRAQEGEPDILLALPANIEHDAMQDVVNAYRSTGNIACVLTKIDEASSLGAVFSVLIRTGLELAYVANGQRIPEDLYPAASRADWLIKHALELMRARHHRVSERYMAENFCGVQIEERA